MHFLGTCALTVAVCAVIGFIFDYDDDSWFFGWLCGACLLQGISEAYQEHHARAIGCLIVAAFFAGASARGLLKRRPAQRGGT